MSGDDPRSRDADSRWQSLTTEARHPASMELDALPREDIIGLLLDEDRRGLEAARDHTSAIAQAASWMAEAMDRGGRVVFLGAGTSGRLGVIEAAECPPTFGTDPSRIQAVIAGGSRAVFSAAEGAEDDRDAGLEEGSKLCGDDLLVGISASSVTPFVVGGLVGARRHGARTVLLTCASDRGLSNLADLVIGLATGPEILTGSTRLKAGSATKAVLNALTTTAMVGQGKVFENMMVDLRPGSAKLRDRAVRIVSEAARVDTERGRKLLDEADGHVKTAILMGLRQVSPETARGQLALAGGDLRAALKLG